MVDVHVIPAHMHMVIGETKICLNLLSDHWEGIFMKPERSPWETFTETGKIDDYLTFCHKRKQELFSGGADPRNVVNNPWNRPAGLQDTRG